MASGCSFTRSSVADRVERSALRTGQTCLCVSQSEVAHEVILFDQTRVNSVIFALCC